MDYHGLYDIYHTIRENRFYKLWYKFEDTCQNVGETRIGN